MNTLSETKGAYGNGRVIVYEPFTPQFARITELDSKGVTFIHRGRELRASEKISLDLFFTDGDTVITDLPGQVVSEAPEMLEDPLVTAKAWKCRVLFAELKKGKQDELMDILHRPAGRS